MDKDDFDETPLEFGAEEDLDRNKRLKHPVAVFFHTVFRTGALVAFFFCGWFSSSFITNFVIIIILLCMDFWTVKNVSGRLLVGLRWWNYVDEDGKSHWVFESRKRGSQHKVTAVESRIFWLSLVAFEVIWIILFFGALVIFSLKWSMVIIVAAVMNGANLYGYIRCKWGSRNKLKSEATNFFSTQLLKSMLMGSSDTKENKDNRQKSAQGP